VKEFCCFLIKGKKPKKPKTKKQTNKNIPSSNAIQFQLVLHHLVFSHQRKRKKKGGVWRQLCECLSDVVAHLPPIVSHLLLQALFI
jgi:hypothetical protein